MPPAAEHVRTQPKSSSAHAAMQSCAALHDALAAQAWSCEQHFCFVHASHAGRSSTFPIFEQSAGAPVSLWPPSPPPLDPLLDDAPPDPPLLEPPPSPETVDEPLDDVPSGGTKSSGGSVAHAKTTAQNPTAAATSRASLLIHG